jgi:hypothetical protein
LVGISSYLLINFWFTRIQANKAAIKALVVNRVGDWGLSIGLFGLLWVFGNIDYSSIMSISSQIDKGLISIISLFLLIGVIGKSAQIGLHTWLIDAMEGLYSRALLKLHYIREHSFILWSTQKILLFGKIQRREQEQFVGNQYRNYILGSSETTREALNMEFKEWFIGFTEGDGSFIINKNGTLEFKVTKSSIDAQILFYIKKELGFGSVSIQDKNNKTHHYRVRDKRGFLKIIEILNGNIRTETKNNQFRLWLKAFNEYYNTDILYIEPSEKPFLNNSWLSGFTDSE